ncbi:hypothetical protein WH47_06566 [Habropoda laboriosa]|uniref:Uncharacterized protein n=1 Tax=Habropoda laboriosa TaxID=597456 RepID=A0A0L7RD81_9HYME|nr:hypothetical protein WH47_06566 [Habropoda laboriosa]
MKCKSIAKANRVRRSSLKSKTPTLVPKVELITENVFVPIARTVFTRERAPVHARANINSSGRNNSSGIRMSLLKKPSCLPVERKDGKGETLDESSTTLLDNQSENYSERSENRKKQLLPFPSSMSDLPFTWLAKRKTVPMKPMNKWKKSGKMDGRTVRNDIGCILSNLSKTNGNSCEKFKLKKVKSGVSGSRYVSEEIGRSSAMNRDEGEKMENEISREPVLLNKVASIRATAKKRNVGRESSFHPYCYTSDAEAIINDTEQINIPVKRIESKVAGRLVGRCTATFDSFLDSNGKEKMEHYHPCRMKYSWQVVGTSSQTSQTLLENLAKEKEGVVEDDETMCNCTVKYSWQIIGITTQTCAKDFTVKECRSAVSFLSARIEDRGGDAAAARTGTVWRNGKRFIVLNNQCSQTFAHKENQTVFTELYELQNTAIGKIKKVSMDNS